MAKTWLVKSSEKKEISSLDELKVLLCANREVDSGDVNNFFDPQYHVAIHSPHNLHQMQEAVDRIFYAIQHNQQIIVYGDYDADGITSTALLVTVLEAVGARVVPFLPHRLEHGYGLNMALVQQLSKEAELIITVDCGVANIEEIAWLKENKVDVVVVDHHAMKDELPMARAVLHPRHPFGAYPFQYLCGAGMAWKLAQGLLRDNRASQAGNFDTEKWLLDLAMLGTIADIVPLLGENRTIVQFGLEVLKRTRRPGLKALMEISGVQVSSLNAVDVGFRLIPRLNAPGRLEHAQPALDLLLAKDLARANVLAHRLEDYNKLRQSISRKVAKEATLQAQADSPVIFAFNINWPAGIVGLAANQLAKKFGRPAIVVGGNGRHAVGSARTPDGFNILTILEPYRDQLLAMGGHAHAAGFSLAPEAVASLGKKLSLSEPDYLPADSQPQLAEGVLHHGLISWDSAQLIEQFEPFGEGNRQPQFIFKRLPVISSRTVGKENQHAKFVFDIDGQSIGGIGFSLGEDITKLSQYADVLACPTVTHYRGRTSLELSVKDVAPAGTVEFGIENLPSKEVVH